jgi:putative ABC transport system substrate-binding protein
MTPNHPLERTRASGLRPAYTGRSTEAFAAQPQAKVTSKEGTRAVKVRLTNAIFAFVLLATPLVVEAQQGEKLRRIGVLATFSSEHPQRDLFDAFRRGLRELGYVEGQNIVIEYRSAQGKVERLPDLFAELTRLKVDLILVLGGTPMARAAKHANVTTPVIAPAMGDPVDDGVAASLAHPGGNITGSTFLGPALVPKRIELLKEAIPGVSRVAALWHPGAYGDRTMTEMLKETDAAGQKLGVQLQLLEARSADDFDRAFSAMTRERARALVVLPSPMFYGEHKRIVELALKNRLPAIFAFREAADAGGLMSYGANLSDLFRRGAIQADKILRGAKPADLPVEQPTKFELVINLKTAKRLGLTIPKSLLLQADQVLE